MPIERRNDYELRKTIDNYRRMAAVLRVAASNAETKQVREQFVSIAKSWEELANDLAGLRKRGSHYVV